MVRADVMTPPSAPLLDITFTFGCMAHSPILVYDSCIECPSQMTTSKRQYWRSTLPISSAKASWVFTTFLSCFTIRNLQCWLPLIGHLTTGINDNQCRCRRWLAQKVGHPFYNCFDCIFLINSCILLISVWMTFKRSNLPTFSPNHRCCPIPHSHSEILVL